MGNCGDDDDDDDDEDGGVFPQIFQQLQVRDSATRERRIQLWHPPSVSPLLSSVNPTSTFFFFFLQLLLNKIVGTEDIIYTHTVLEAHRRRTLVWAYD